MKGPKKISTLNLVLIIQLVIMIVLSTVLTKTVGTTTRRNSIEHMQTIADERANIILNYVKNAEETLTYFSKGQEVRALLERQAELGQSTDILEDSASAELVAAAQAYTEDFSADISNLEGLWIGSWETHCIAHTNAGTVGITTRDKTKMPEKLKELQDAMLAAENGVYNTGIIISPATGKQIVSMYKAVYDDRHQPIGFVGLGIFTDKLVRNLDALEIKGFENSKYTMVNVSNKKYIFHEDSNLVDTEVSSKKISKLCDTYRASKNTDDGYYTYEKGNKSYVSIYTYIPQYGWILMIDDEKNEVYALARMMRMYMLAFAVAIIVLMVVFFFINKKQQDVSNKLAASIVKNNKTKDSLYTAMFKDVLTEVNNRVSLSMDLDEIKADKDEPRYFAMFNIGEFSIVNSQLGNDIGDWLLVRTVDILKQVFKGSKIYRTGSDEFVVVINGKGVEQDAVMENVNDAFNRLCAKQNTPIGKQNFKYKVAVVKKNSDYNTSVVTTLKDMTNRSAGQVSFANLVQ